MAVNIATLAIKFVADTTGIKQGVASVVSNVLTGAAAFIGINKAINAFSSGAERIDKMSKVADRLGVSFNTIQNAALTGKLAGVELESLTDAIDKMSKNIGSGGMSLDKRFLEQADAIAAIKDPAMQAAKAMEIFGKSGAKLLPLLKGGKNAFREAADFIKRFDLAISDVDAKNVERMNDSWTKIGAVISGVTDKILSEMAPGMGAFLDHTIDQLETLGQVLRDFGITWEGIGHNTTLFFAEAANLSELWQANLKGWQMVGNYFGSGWEALGKDTPEERMKIGEEMHKRMEKLWNEGMDHIDAFFNDTAGKKIRDEAEKRKIGGREKAGAFGGINTTFAPGSADRDSQAAAKIINSAGTMSEADKKANEIAKNTAATKEAVEKVLKVFSGNVPVLALGGI